MTFWKRPITTNGFDLGMAVFGGIAVSLLSLVMMVGGHGTMAMAYGCVATVSCFNAIRIHRRMRQHADRA